MDRPCTKSKLDRPSPPRELYEPSAYFRKAREFVEAQYDEWYILSAKHGLLHPDGAAIEPYDDTLTTAGIERRREWAANVFSELIDEEIVTGSHTLFFHTGRPYYEQLLPHFEETDVEIEIPTEGLRYGEKLAWYDQQT